MESYNSPVKVLNSDDNGYLKWKCDFELKNDGGVKLPASVTQRNNFKRSIQSVTIKNNGTRQLKVHEKGNFRSKKYRSRIPAIREMVNEIEQKIVEELGPAPDLSSEQTRTTQIGSMTKIQFLDMKKNEFYANCFTRQMKHEGGILVNNLKRVEKQLQDQAQELYQDACAFNDFLKETDELCKQAKAYQADETAKLEVAKDAFLMDQGKSVGVKRSLVTMDEQLSTYFNSKCFLLLVFHNSKCLPRKLVSVDNWKVFRKTTEYSPLFPDKLLPHASLNSRRTLYPGARPSRDSVTVKRSNIRTCVLLRKLFQPSKSRVPSMRSLHATNKANTRKTLAFLNEEFSTKVRFPEEWTDDTTFVDSESNKLASVLHDTKWLLNLNHEFEEANLRFIMRFQSKDKQLERMKIQYQNVSEKLNAEADFQNEHAEAIQYKIDELEAKADKFERMAKSVLKGENEEGLTIEQIFEQISKSLKKVYHAIMGDSVELDEIPMLTKIEFTCYGYFDLMDKFGPSIFALLKLESKKRRAQEFEQKELMVIRLAEEKMNQSRLRNAVCKAFVGRKLVFRSQPPVKKSQKKTTKGDEEDLSYYFT